MPAILKSRRMREVVENAMRGEIYRQLSETRGNVALAATNLGYHRTAFYNLMKRLGIRLERHVRATIVLERNVQ